MDMTNRRSVGQHGLVWMFIALFGLYALSGCGDGQPGETGADSKPAPVQVTGTGAPTAKQPVEEAESATTQQPTEKTEASTAQQPAAESATEEPTVDDVDRQTPTDEKQPAIPEKKPDPKSDAVPFAGSMYRMYVEDCNWTEAVEKCEALGGRLASIQTREQFDFVYDLAFKALRDRGACWLGGSDREEEGTWRWMTGEEVDLTVFPDTHLFDRLNDRTRDYLCLLNSRRITCRQNGMGANGYVCEWSGSSSSRHDDVADQDGATESAPAVTAKEPETQTPEAKTDGAQTEQAPDPDEVKAFIDAAWRGEEAKVLQFLDKGMDIGARDSDGYTALHKATFGSELGMAKLLLEKGANVMARNNFGQTPLHYPMSKEVAELLIARGADVNARGWDDDVPLKGARKKEVVEFLVAQGADVNARDTNGKTPIYWQIWRGDTEATMAMLALGAQVNLWDRDGKTPLHTAAEQNHHEITPMLLEKGARLEARDFEGRTPLHAAGRRNAKEAATLLIENGAEVNAKDHAGHTPLDVAVAEKREDVIEILKDAGGQPSDSVVQTGQGGNAFYWMAASTEQVKELFSTLR